ncbi:hypothetical protein GCM10023172_42760 [Hymenobacter ginsengisoli]|uniref:Uncharacterized protein n=1 Tax=Hymenobacter ginsengisoli TaxID=1051626 RepID=A0ABP8QRC2_9BACT
MGVGTFGKREAGDLFRAVLLGVALAGVNAVLLGMDYMGGRRMGMVGEWPFHGCPLSWCLAASVWCLAVSV